MERLHDGRLVEFHVMGQDRYRVARSKADRVGHLVGPAHDQLVDIGEARRRGKRGPAVDHDGLVAKLTGEVHEETGHLNGAHHDQAWLDRVGLQEDLPALDQDR